MPSGWAPHIGVDELTPQYVFDTTLLGINLGAAYVEPPLLPDGSPNPNAGELTARATMALQALIDALMAEVQGKLGIRFARQRVITDPDEGQVLGVDYDLKGERLHYFRQNWLAQHFSLPLPYSNVTSVERVRLFYERVSVYEVPRPWVSFTSKEGVLRINPALANGVLQSNFAGFDAVFFNIFYRDVVPNCWSIDYTFGHNQIDADAARYIALRAAIQVLGLAGMGRDVSNGLSGESLVMDGVQETVNIATGRYGPYSGAIATLMDELKAIDIWQMRLTKKGMKVAFW